MYISKRSNSSKSKRKTEIQDKYESKNRPALLIYIVSVLLYAAIFSFWRVAQVPLNVHGISILVAATCFIPIFRWYGKGNRSIPMFELIVLSFALQFSTPTYLQHNQVLIMGRIVQLSWDDVFLSLIYVEIGVVCLIFGYYVTRQITRNQILPQIDIPFEEKARSTYILLAIIFGSMINFLQIFTAYGLSFRAIISLLARQLSVGIILLAFDVYSGRETRSIMKLLLYGSVFMTSLVGLSTGMLENAFIPLVVILIVRWQVLGKLPWFLIGAGLSLFLILNPAKFEFREQVWFSGREYDFSARVLIWGELAAESVNTFLEPQNEETVSENLDTTTGRFDLLHKFTYVHRLTPTIKPFYYGKTYEYFLYAWIPRIIWPDKPYSSDANDTIDLDYGLKTRDSVATFGIGLLPEAYVNFGVIGIVFVMMGQGAVIAILDRMFNGPRSDGGRAVYLSVMVFFLNGIGSSAAIRFGGLVQNIFASAVIMRPFAMGFTRKNLREKFMAFLEELKVSKFYFFPYYFFQI